MTLCQIMRLSPASALIKLAEVPSQDQRCSMARTLAAAWRQIDINTAWNAVTRSPLSAAEKQPMFNELWG